MSSFCQPLPIVQVFMFHVQNWPGSCTVLQMVEQIPRKAALMLSQSSFFLWFYLHFLCSFFTLVIYNKLIHQGYSYWVIAKAKGFYNLQVNYFVHWITGFNLSSFKDKWFSIYSYIALFTRAAICNLWICGFMNFLPWLLLMIFCLSSLAKDLAFHQDGKIQILYLLQYIFQVSQYSDYFWQMNLFLLERITPVMQEWLFTEPKLYAGS